VTQSKRLSQEAENSLLGRLRARDEAALGELYDLLASWVLGLARRITRDQAEAEEVLSDTFVQVWHNAQTYDPARGPFVPWVLTIARNRALDSVRRRRRWWRKAETWSQAMGDDGIVAAPAPHEASVPGWPLHQAVHKALASLPDEQRRVVALAYFEGLPHSEIARRTGQPLGTVKTRLRLAHAKLSESLKHLKDWLT
jgi:RNA polymerase sigma-70 factor (ECF subfamily)